MAIDISRDLLGLNSALAQTRAELKNNKSELTAVNRAMRDNADNAELQRIKQELLAQQLQLTKEQISTLSSAQTKLNEGQEKGGAIAGTYDSTLRQLQISYLGLQGQLEKSTEATEKDTIASERNVASVRERINATRSLIVGMSSALSFAQGLTKQFADWNAVNEDGTPKMDNMTKAITMLNNVMMAATIISAFAKAVQTFGIAGTIIGGAMIAGMVAAMVGLLNSVAPTGTGKQQSQTPSYGGGGGYVGYGNVVGGGGVSSYSEKTINYNMNINANRYGAEFANNPAVIKPIVSALNQELGTKVK